MSFIELHPWRKAMNFGVEVVKPRFRIDGGPDGFLESWNPTRIPVAVGPHRVEMWIHWTINTHMGLNAIDVTVPPGGVRVSWRSPSTAFQKGKMEVAAPGDPAAATGRVGVGGPPGAPPVAAGAAPAGWLADPSGKHQLRYWDGAAWTAHVSDGGVVSEDLS